MIFRIKIPEKAEQLLGLEAEPARVAHGVKLTHAKGGKIELEGEPEKLRFLRERIAKIAGGDHSGPKRWGKTANAIAREFDRELAKVNEATRKHGEHGSW